MMNDVEKVGLPTVEDRQSPIMEQLAMQKKSLDVLHNLLSNLEDRLTEVLGSVPPEMAGDKNSETDYGSGVYLALRKNNAHLQEVIEWTRRVIDRLEL